MKTYGPDIRGGASSLPWLSVGQAFSDGELGCRQGIHDERLGMDDSDD